MLFLLGSVLLVAAPAGAVGVQWAATSDAPPPERKLCSSTGPGKRGDRLRGTERTEQLCGSRGPDSITAVGGGDYVDGKHGNDDIGARNGQPDEVYGGPDLDRGRFDPCDRVWNVEKRAVAGRCPDVHAGRRFVTASPAPYSRPVIECVTTSDGKRWIDVLFEPQMRALDVTPLVDFQTVAWSAVILEFVNGKWEVLKKGSWFWDRTYDEQVERFPGNFWRSFRDDERTFVSYEVYSPGVYTVGVLMHWYKTRDAPAHDEVDLARAHYGPAANSTNDACSFEA